MDERAELVLALGEFNEQKSRFRILLRITDPQLIYDALVFLSEHKQEPKKEGDDNAERAEQPHS